MIVLQRIPCAPCSTASTRVSEFTPPFAALYADRPGTPNTAPPEEMFTIDPPPASIMWGIAYFDVQNMLVSVPRRMSSHSGVVSSSTGLMLTFTNAVGAALLISVVIGPKASTVAATAVPDAGLVRDVERDEHRFAAGLADPADVLLALLHGSAAHHDLRTLLGEHLRDGAADPARGAGDERDLSNESHPCILAAPGRKAPDPLYRPSERGATTSSRAVGWGRSARRIRQRYGPLGA